MAPLELSARFKIRICPNPCYDLIAHMLAVVAIIADCLTVESFEGNSARGEDSHGAL